MIRFVYFPVKVFTKSYKNGISVFYPFGANMGLSTADVREIKSIIIGVFNEKFLAEIADKVASSLIKKFEEQLKNQEAEISNLRDDIATLRRENSELQSELDRHDQASRSANIRIFGLQSEKDENVQEKVINLLQNKLKLNINNADIKKCHRVSNKVSNNKQPAVLVRFASDQVRFSVLKNRKMLKNSGVYIHEDLTKLRLALLNRAKEKYGDKSAWVWKGSVFVKCMDNTIKRIISEADLVQMDN